MFKLYIIHRTQNLCAILAKFAALLIVTLKQISFFSRVQCYHYYYNKKLSYCWETVRRESMPRIAEMDVEMTT